MASMATTVPLNSKASSSFGIAVISLDFSSTLRWASTIPLPSAQAETMGTNVFLPVSRLPHNAFPSSAWLLSTKPKPFSISRGSSAANTRLKVSCDGMPEGSVKNVFSHSRLASP